MFQFVHLEEELVHQLLHGFSREAGGEDGTLPLPGQVVQNYPGVETLQMVVVQDVYCFICY